MSDDHLSTLVADFAHKAGLEDLKLENGRCAIKAGERLSIAVERSPDEDWVYFYTHLDLVPSHNREAYYRHLLELNFLGIKTRGGAFSIDKNQDDVIFYDLHPLELMNGSIFAEALSRFIEVSLQLEEKLQQLDQPPGDLPENPEFGIQV